MVFRDLVLFQIKLLFDGIGDLVLAPVATIAVIWDYLFSKEPGKTFYAVLHYGEKWDRWLSLYRPGKDVGKVSGSLLEAGKLDAGSFLGKMEGYLPRSWRGVRESDLDDLDLDDLDLDELDAADFEAGAGPKGASEGTQGPGMSEAPYE